MNAATDTFDAVSQHSAITLAAQALQNSYRSAPAVEMPVAEPTRIAKVISTLNRARKPRGVQTMREYLSRMQQIPRAARTMADVDAFAIPDDLSMSALRLTTGMLSSRFLSNDNKPLLDEPVSLIREMLLVAFEAKPRPISFGITGYRMSDFIAYIYQDVAMEAMGMTSAQRRKPFAQNVEEIKAWFQFPSGKSAMNSPRRHVRRRLMVLLDRTNHQVASLFEDREIPSELLNLVHKLMERDDDLGFTEGRLRDFRAVRDDFNLVAEHCVRTRFALDTERLSVLDRVICPSLVDNFSSYAIDLPRGRSSNREEVKKAYLDNVTASQRRFLEETAKATTQSMRLKGGVKLPISPALQRKFLEEAANAAAQSMRLKGGVKLPALPDPQPRVAIPSTALVQKRKDKAEKAAAQAPVISPSRGGFKAVPAMSKDALDLLDELI